MCKPVHSILRLYLDADTDISMTYKKDDIYMGKTSTQSKAKYNKDTYSSYIIRVRKDTGLYGKIEDFMSCKGTSLNYLVVKLLTEHFRKYE